MFPSQPGAIVKGIPTAHSASPIKEHISSGSDVYVWSSAKGTHQGQAIEPLFKSIPQIVQEDKLFYPERLSACKCFDAAIKFYF